MEAQLREILAALANMKTRQEAYEAQQARLLEALDHLPLVEGAANAAADSARQAQAAAEAVAATAPKAAADVVREAVAAAASGAAPAGESSSSGGRNYKQAVKVNSYPKLKVHPKGEGLQLANWFAGMEAAMNLAKVPDDEWANCAVVNGMDGEAQASCFAMLQKGDITCWRALKETLLLNYGEHNLQRSAENELEKLAMANTSLQALSTYVHKSRVLHLQAGDLLTPQAKYKYFMRGLNASLQKQLVTTIATELAKQERNPPPNPIDWESFEEASKLALHFLGNRLAGEATMPHRDGPVPMEVSAMVLAAMQKAGWRPPGPKGKALGKGEPKGSAAAKGKQPAAAATRWTPKLSNKKRAQLKEQGRCFCCEKVADHSWRDCPENPDNRGN